MKIIIMHGINIEKCKLLKISVTITVFFFSLHEVFSRVKAPVVSLAATQHKLKIAL